MRGLDSSLWGSRDCCCSWGLLVKVCRCLDYGIVGLSMRVFGGYLCEGEWNCGFIFINHYKSSNKIQKDINYNDFPERQRNNHILKNINNREEKINQPQSSILLLSSKLYILIAFSSPTISSKFSKNNFTKNENFPLDIKSSSRYILGRKKQGPNTTARL